MSSTIIRLRKKGQITLPQAMREALHLADGAALVAAFDGDAIILTPYEPQRRAYDPTLIRDARALAARIVAERGGTYLPSGSIVRMLDELRSDDAARDLSADSDGADSNRENAGRHD